MLNDQEDTVANNKPSRAGRTDPQFLLRLPADLRDQLHREAELNGRSLNSEILHRIQATIELASPIHKKMYGVAEGNPTPYGVSLSDTERTMLAIFKKMPAEKQLALISLFK